MVSAIWIGWFAVPSAIVLFLILFVIDKFAKCPSVEKWIQCLDRTNDLPPRFVQPDGVQQNVVNRAVENFLIGQIIIEQEIRRQNNNNPNMVEINNI